MCKGRVVYITIIPRRQLYMSCHELTLKLRYSSLHCSKFDKNSNGCWKTRFSRDYRIFTRNSYWVYVEYSSMLLHCFYHSGIFTPAPKHLVSLFCRQEFHVNWHAQTRYSRFEYSRVILAHVREYPVYYGNLRSIWRRIYV